MDTWIDVVSIAVRALSFVAMLQAAGVVVLLMIFSDSLTQSRASIVRLGWLSAWSGVLLVAAHQLTAPMRMTGTLAGAFDTTLQNLALWSSSGQANGFRIVGLILIAFGLHRTRYVSSLLGALCIPLSFALTGHTAVHDHHSLLTPLLFIHLLVVTFWFGALLPLIFITQREAPTVAAQVVAKFSVLASWLVPLILVAGVLLAWTLLPNSATLWQPYGLLLMSKLFGFLLLMGLAALNKWRLAPALVSGDPLAARAFRRSVLAEFVLICAVLSVTAVMTGWFSPEA